MLGALAFIIAVALLAFIRAGCNALTRKVEPPRPPLARFPANDK